MTKPADNQIEEALARAALVSNATGGVAANAGDAFRALAKNSKALRVNGPVRQAVANAMANSLVDPDNPLGQLVADFQISRAQKHPLELLRKAAMSPLARSIGAFGGVVSTGLAVNDIRNNGLNTVNGLDAAAGVTAMTPTLAAIPANGWLLGRAIGEVLPDSWNHQIGKGIADSIDFGANAIRNFGR